MRRAIAGTVLAALGALTLVDAQDAPPVFRAATDVVQVDVSVLDKDRKPVRGLTAADFTVLEDGKPRPIVAFVPIDLPDVVHETAAWAHDVTPDAEVTTNALPPEGRLVVIVMDWSMRPGDQPAARRIARAAVDQLGPDDLASVVFTSAFSNAGVSQDFTHDRARLLADIDRPFAGALTVLDGPDMKGFIEDPNGIQSGDCYCRMCVMETIGSIADALRDIPNRRKVVMFIGDYFFAVDDASPSSITSYQPDSVGIVAQQHPGLAGFVGGDTKGICRGPVDEARDKMMRSLGLANLTIDVLDPVGLAAGSPLLGIDETTRQSRLSYLADATGGRRVFNTNAPEELVPAIFAETQAYYLLGFEPDKTTGQISVKVNRPGVTVRSRDAYDERATATHAATMAKLAPSQQDMSESLPKTELPLEVLAEPFAGKGSDADVAILLGVGADAAAASRHAEKAVRVQILTAAFDRHAKAVATDAETLTTSAASYDALTRLRLKPGHYELRVAADADGSGQGSVYTSVDVPDFTSERLALSGVVLGADPGAIAAPPARFKDLLPFVPTVRRTFAPADRVTAFVRAYQSGTPQPATITAEVLDGRGTPVFTRNTPLTADAFAGDHAADETFVVPTTSLAPGRYLLRVDAKSGNHTARRDVVFTIAARDEAAKR